MKKDNSNNKKTQAAAKTLALLTGMILVASFGLSANMMAAEAQLTQDSTKYQRFIMQSSKCSNTTSCADMVSKINAAVNSDDQVIFHVGVNQILTTTQLDALDSINLGDSRKGIEVFSKAEADYYEEIARERGFGFLVYDLEGSIGNGPSPDAEQQDPVQAFEDFKQIVISPTTPVLYAHGAPERAITASNTYMQSIIQDVSRFHIQSQALQDDDSTCNTMSTFVDGRVAQFETWRSTMEGKLTFQVSSQIPAAAGKTVYDTMKDCIDATLDGDVDGVSVWYGGTFYDNTGADGYTALIEYIQSKT